MTIVREFSKIRSERYKLAMSRAPNARTAELVALGTVLKAIGVTRCRSIVEIGSGHGYATGALLDYVSTDGLIRGVEHSPDMAAQIPRHPKIRPLADTLEGIDIDDGSVDLVVSLATFHHITNKSLIVQQIRRLLRPGGHCVIGDVNDGTPVQAFFDNVVLKFCLTGHEFDFLDRAWVRQLAMGAGLEHVSSSVRNTDWVFDSEEAMVVFVRNLMSLEIDTAELKSLLMTWLHPVTDLDGHRTVLPWSLGFHVLRRTN